MKNLKNLLFSLMALAFIAVFTTSCDQPEILPDEITAVNLTSLAERLATSPHFQASIDIHEKIGNDLMIFVKDNNFNVTKDDIVFTSFINSYAVSKKELELYKSNLVNDIPELKAITEQVFDDAVSLALTLLKEQKLDSRNCVDVRTYCAYAAYLKYYYGQSSYFSYYAEYTACIQEYFSCI